MKNEIGFEEVLKHLVNETPAIVEKGSNNPVFVDKEEVLYQALKALPKAIALAAKEAEPEVDGTRRVEIFGGMILRVRLVDEREGTGLADGVTIPEHYTLKIKPHKGMLSVFEKVFSKRFTR